MPYTAGDPVKLVAPQVVTVLLPRRAVVTAIVTTPRLGKQLAFPFRTVGYVRGVKVYPPPSTGTASTVSIPASLKQYPM